MFSDGDRFAFDNPQAAAALGYVIDLINTDHVAPPASDTNDNGDFSRNQFLSGRMAVLQSGTYNLAQVFEQARFDWGVTMLPTGPAGRVSVTNGIVAAGNPATRHPEAVRRVLAWLGGTGNAYLGRRGAAIPACTLGPAGVLRLLGGQGRGRRAVLLGPGRPAHRRTRRCGFRRRIPGDHSRSSTRCSWAGGRWPRPWRRPSRPPTPPRNAKGPASVCRRQPSPRTSTTIATAASTARMLSATQSAFFGRDGAAEI